MFLALLHAERPKLYTMLAFLSTKGLSVPDETDLCKKLDATTIYTVYNNTKENTPGRAVGSAGASDCNEESDVPSSLPRPAI